MHNLDTRPQEAEVLLSQRQAEILGVSPRTLEAWRYKGGGPLYIRYSARCVRYRLSDLNEWLNGKKAASTSEYPTSGYKGAGGAAHG